MEDIFNCLVLVPSAFPKALGAQLYFRHSILVAEPSLHREKPSILVTCVMTTIPRLRLCGMTAACGRDTFFGSDRPRYRRTWLLTTTSDFLPN